MIPTVKLPFSLNLADLFRSVIGSISLTDILGTFLGTLIDVAKDKGGPVLERSLTIKEASVRTWSRTIFRKAGGKNELALARFENRAVLKCRALAAAFREAVEAFIPEPSDLEEPAIEP